MNSRWKAFLDEQQSGNPKHQSANQVREGDQVLVDLSHLRLIRVAGDDALEFLQGQTTNDVRNITETRFQMSGVCTPKGRLLANFLIFRRQTAYLLQMPEETHQIILKRLPMFVLMSKVDIEDASDSLIRFGFMGDGAANQLASHFEKVPGTAWESVQKSGFTLLRLPGPAMRFEILGDVDAMIPLWEALGENASIQPDNYWSLQDIRTGLPTVQGLTTDAFVPQMINMQLINGISFTKGCYTGQEVVARMKYLGKLKRRMYLAHVDTDSKPQPGDEIYSSSSQSAQGAGKVVDAQSSPSGGYEVLAVLEMTSHDANDAHLHGTQGPKLMFRPLPYSFENT